MGEEKEKEEEEERNEEDDIDDGAATCHALIGSERGSSIHSRAKLFPKRIGKGIHSS